ncbi:MAG TPA: GNAT family N-acetyltransferase [Segeticoccus sp.]|uniref:GNAT family N-acetyltransferase n=1 Tax=Segeticoccus sp. TaxID=2706531 RepID=UPI002D80DA87|nr:GNAT family N-acetyltransferase [Segeticoccus sp.]HET8601761.1 GNAT family N-acetyltransferase [Segeticoccus sp.]
MTAPEAAHPSTLDLPDGWSARPTALADVDGLTRLLWRAQEAGRGWASVQTAEVERELSGRGAEPREHLVLTDAEGALRAWGTVHDRAKGRVLVSVAVDPELEKVAAARAARSLFAWAEHAGGVIAVGRGLDGTQLDSGAFSDDPRQQRFLADAGYQKVRTWWQMSRPVAPEEADPDAFPAPKPGVRIRRIALSDDGLPDEGDLHAVHDVLESSFADHFNSRSETFDEFLSRLRESPGHRWDHWWIAELTDDGPPDPTGASRAPGVRAVGAVIATVIPPPLVASGIPQPGGSYVDYIGVLSSARGRGVAKSLLRAVIADAAQRGRAQVGLEVDADSPTGADQLYSSMGWRTKYRTQSWHKDIEVPR